MKLRVSLQFDVEVDAQDRDEAVKKICAAVSLYTDATIVTSNTRFVAIADIPMNNPPSSPSKPT